ncbi:MAG: fimbria/pilus periplasmic chaperone [Pseudomonas sp.]|nr:fimbria/pilus periplasmic chaperone [Pseudomonas sp.]
MSTFLLFSFISSASAAVVIAGTRVIYPAEKREVVVQLNNSGELPSLVQVWVDDGDVNKAPDELHVPFVLTPPVFRIEPGQGQSLRLAYTKEPLSEKTESLFWLNVLDVPPIADPSSHNNQMQLAIRTRIKILFRPPGLDRDGARSAASHIVWSINRDQKKNRLEARNDSPYHVAVSSYSLLSNHKEFSGAEGASIKPQSSHIFSLEGWNGVGDPSAVVNYETINDNGAKTQQVVNLSN